MAFRRSPKESAKVGKYTLLETLGEGGFGTVRKAFNTEDGNLVAIKILDKADLQLHDMTQNVRKEITLLTTLHHPNIVSGYEVLNSKNKLFLVMEYVNGGDMHSALQKKKRFSEEEAQHFFSSLISCLDYCHSLGVYHRDLKLENILLNSRGELKVCDFGLASVREVNAGKNSLCRTIVGTEDFSSPEILRNIPYKGDEADMWSAGILLFTMLSGYCPFQGRSPAELHQRVITCNYSFPKGFPEQAKEIVSKLLVPASKGRLSAANTLKISWVNNQMSTNGDGRNCPPGQNESSPKGANVTFAITPTKATVNEKKSDKKDDIEEYDSQSSFHETNSVHSFHSLRLEGKVDNSLYLAMGRANIAEFTSLMEKMRHPRDGIQIQDRRYRLRVFSKCFVACEAVSWMSSNLSCSRQEALTLGRRFVKSEVFHHVCRDHDFKDEYLFFRWLDDEPENTLVLNLYKPWYKSTVRPYPDSLVFELLNHLLSICASHQALHDFRAIDIAGVQRDDSFRDFRAAAGELQIVEIEMEFTEDAEKISFLVNLYNLLWLHARIHIGDFDEMSYYALEQKALSFKYEMSSIRISLNDVNETLFGKRNDLKSFNEERNTSGSMNSFYQTATRRIKSSKKQITASRFRDVLRPDNCDPLVHFLVSDGAPHSPVIRTLSANHIESEFVRKAAGEYLNSVLEVDVNSVVLAYPEKVARFRRSLRLQSDKEFVEQLKGICEGFPIESKLKEMQKRSSASKTKVRIVVKGEKSLPYSVLLLAPRVMRISSDT